MTFQITCSTEKNCVQMPISLTYIALDFSCLKTYSTVRIPIYSTVCFKVVCFCALSAMLAKILASNIPAKGERFLLSLVFSSLSLFPYLSHSVSLHSRPFSLAWKAQTDAVSCVLCRCVGVWSPEGPDSIPACCVIIPC